MGLLSLGTPLEWDQVKNHVDHVRDHGIIQLINLYRRFKDRRGDHLKWGDEVEYMVVKLDPETKKPQLTLRQEDILDQLISQEKSGKLRPCNVSFHQEYGRYMLEATPATPYSGEFRDLLVVEENMRRRRSIAETTTTKDECVVSITAYPLMGVGEFTAPYTPPTGNASRSLFLPDDVINTHLRFPTLTANIRKRRGEKVAINVPLYRDSNTAWSQPDPTIPWDRNLYSEDANARDGAALENHIYMDSMGFGMGCSCVQLTFQATDIQEARTLYDQLTPLAPIMLALCGAAPIYRGYLSDQDARWNVVSGSVDDRTRAERGLEPETAEQIADSTTRHNSARIIPKSRYDSVDCYLSEDPILVANQALYNDVPVVINERVKSQLEAAGMDPMLVQHFSHLFIRDPLVIFKELLDQDDATSTDHFENIQSTNWQSIRFKPPPSDDIGWRVEFRPMDVQMTDFENAAVSVFIVLLTRCVLSYGLRFLTPISKVDENMRRAHHRDAVNSESFWFRTNIRDQTPTSDPGFKQLCMNQIINGGDNFTGLVPLIKDYLVSMNVDMDTLCRLNPYLDLISKRASGELQTNAAWMREFVDNHPDYNHDSVISESITYDMVEEIERLSSGQDWDTAGRSMLGGMRSPSPAANGNSNGGSKADAKANGYTKADAANGNTNEPAH